MDKTQEIKIENLAKTAENLLDSGQNTLICLTGIDYIKKIKLIYRFGDLEKSQFTNIEIILDENTHPPTLSHLFPSANWLEREVYDLFGIKFINHPNLIRILNPENFEGYPLLKEQNEQTSKSNTTTKQKTDPNQLSFF